jgi:hypothetical protein
MRQLDTRLAASMNTRYPRVDANARGWVELEFIVHAVDMSDAVSKAVVMARTVSGSVPLSCKVVAQDDDPVEIHGHGSRFGRHAAHGERVLRPTGLG